MTVAIVVVTGASGSGKTAVVRALEAPIDAVADALAVQIEKARP